MCIAADVLTLHYSPENWGPEDTEKFYPLRHSAEHKRNPACYLSFGYGPRSNDFNLRLNNWFILISFFKKVVLDKDLRCLNLNWLWLKSFQNLMLWRVQKHQRQWFIVNVSQYVNLRMEFLASLNKESCSHLRIENFISFYTNNLIFFWYYFT